MRLYNGCPDDELAAIWKSRDDARSELLAEAQRLFGPDSRAQCTYFPLEGKYACCLFRGSKYFELTDFGNSVEESCRDAIRKMRSMCAGRVNVLK